MAELLFTKQLDKELLSKELPFRKGDSVCIKLHYGEPGSKTSINPKYVKTLINVLKAKGCQPFLFDSSVMYNSPRNNPEGHKKSAETQGFTEQTMGCPLVFSDEFITKKTQHMDVEVCKPIIDADGMVVLTHVKGHPCCGMGGAIKNIGMGGVSKKTKTDIHNMASVEYVSGCSRCGICAKLCPFGFIKVTDKPELSGCIGCNQCIDNCPAGSFRVKVAGFDTLLAESASQTIKGNEYYINVIENITTYCDCRADGGAIISDDVGILYGKDPVSIDYASVKLVQEKTGKDIWKETHHRYAEGHVEEAQRLGMGKLHYTIKNVH